ncbi:MAG TPA: hypothetical protein VFD58_35220 [Blastocatellia bacterium]|nr:hypothetical protein [Blastocatellia bacterium]
MSPQTAEVTRQAINEATVWLTGRTEEIRSLQLTERLLASIEQTPAESAPELYETSGMTEAWELLNQAIRESDLARVAEARERLSAEICRWRLSISERDVRMSAHSLRRFLACADESPDARALAALLRFYRSLSYIGQAQGKYDLLVTRLFTLTTEDHRRKLRFGRDQLVTYLERMFAVWEEGEAIVPDQVVAEIALAQFAHFTVAVNRFERLDELVSDGLFDRIRNFKGSLGKTFFTPEVTAAVVECNLTCVNQFVALIEAAGEQLHAAPDAFRDIAYTFCDTSTDVSDHLRSLLDAFRQADEPPDAPDRRRTQHLIGLLGLADAPAIEHAGAATPVGAPPGFSDLTITDEAVRQPDGANHQAAPAALPGLVETPDELERKDENRVIVAMFRQSSPEIQSLDLRLFLSAVVSEETGDASESAAVRRQALRLIINSDHLLHQEPESDEDPAGEMQTRLIGLLDEIREFGFGLQQAINRAKQSGQHTIARIMLEVSSHLANAETTLQSGIEQRYALELARAGERRQRAAREQRRGATQSLGTAKAAPVALTPLQKVGRFKWLIAASILLAVALTVMPRFTRNQGAVAGVDSNVQAMDLSQLPDGGLLKAARLHKQLLVCIVSEKWHQLPDDQRRDKLQAWLTFGKGKGITQVTLMSDEGKAIGNASAIQISLEKS